MENKIRPKNGQTFGPEKTFLGHQIWRGQKRLANVCRCDWSDQIWRNFAQVASKLKSWANFFEELSLIWQNFEPTLANFYAIGQIFIF